MFEKIVSLDQLVKSYYKARRGKREKPIICKFEFFLENNLIELRQILLSGSYFPLPYTHFTIFDPKTRKISAPAFRDRVVHHALVANIESIFEKKFIFDSYACRKDKGTHLGARRVKKFLMAARCLNGKDTDLWVLQCDIKKYFQDISWDILFTVVSKSVCCPQTLDLIKKIITTHNDVCSGVQKSKQNIEPCQLDLFSFSTAQVLSDSETPSVSVSERKGLPIGNLTSQLFANVYMNEFDHFVKYTLKERWYARYMDDFLFIHPSKDYLLELLDIIKPFLKNNLHLELHPRKVTIKNVTEGVPFVGYRIFYNHVLVRGDTLRHMQRKYWCKQKLFKQGKLSEFDLLQSQAAIRGHLKHANTYGLYKSMIGKGKLE